MNTIHSNSLFVRIDGSTITLEPPDIPVELEQPNYGIWPILMDIKDGCYIWTGKEWVKENGWCDKTTRETRRFSGKTDRG